MVRLVSYIFIPFLNCLPRSSSTIDANSISARMTGPVPAMHIDSSSVTTTQITPPSSNETPSTSSQSVMERNTHSQSDDLAIDEALGTPFKLEWIKVLRLPFARTRTIVNSFNMNREVKISRDGASSLVILQRTSVY